MANRMRYASLTIVISTIFLLQPAFGDVIINEIMYNPTTEQGGDSLIEWIELYNNGNQAVNVSGWTLTDNSATDTLLCYDTTLPNCDVINASSFAIITDSDTVLYQNFSILTNVTRIKVDDNAIGNGLRNSGDLIMIKNGTSLTDVVNYTDFTSVTEGYTLERIDTFGTNTSSNWRSSLFLNGTPGSRNSVTPSEHELAVYPENITFSPTDPSPRTGVNISVTIQNNGISNETNVNISLYNISSSDTTLIHSQLSNITKQSYASMTIQWNHTLKGNSTVLVRIENFTDDNTTNNNATKNITFDFHLVINEVMYNPPGEIGSDVDFEWIEIYNNATYIENLTGWILECDNKQKSLSDNLASGSYLVFAKDRTEFYTYYSSSIDTISQTCSLNNDGDTIKLIFNDSRIYYEEIATYSSGWGADGTGYSLEKKNPTADNNSTNWAESKVYGGTPGARNNPDSQIKSSLKETITTVAYRTYTETIYSNKTEETPDFKIVSLPVVVYVNEPFKATVNMRSSEEQTVTVYSYAYDGRKIISDGFDGNNWKGTWTANKKDVEIGPTSVYVEFENKIKSDVSPGKYQFKVRIKEETDLTRYIEVLPEKKATQPVETNEGQLNIKCEQREDQVIITIEGSTERSILLLHFSEELTKNETLNINGSLTHAVNLENGYNSIIFVENEEILDSCNFLLQKSSPITGRTIQPISVNKILIIAKSWFEKLSFLSIFRNF